ncbi:unnamed protein product, partial [Prorocentrum cordatum]
MPLGSLASLAVATIAGAAWRLGNLSVESPLAADFGAVAAVAIAMVLRAGQRVLVQWERGRAPQARLLIAPASAEEFELDTEAVPYGDQWNLSPAFFLECLAFVTGIGVDRMLQTALEHSDEWGEPPRPRITDKYLAQIVDSNAMLSFTISGTSLDARVLGIRETNEQGRHLNWRDAVSESSETDLPKFLISGPRTTFWVSCCIRDHDVAPRSRHAKWRAEVGLTAGDQSVIDREFCCRLLQLAVVYDQLNITELACMELVSRKSQMCEYRHRDRAIGATQGDDLLEDADLYLSLGKTRGLVMVSPSLLSYVSDKLRTEAAILKDKRKMWEERTEQQTSADSKEGKGGQAALELGHPQPGRRGRRRRAAQNAFVNSWTWECVAAINWPCGKEGSPDFDAFFLSQRAGVLDLRGRLASLGPPPASSAAALSGLRRNAPGYLEEPAKPAKFAVDSIALPLDDVECKPGDHEVGEASDLRRDWKGRYSRPKEEQSFVIRPHFDEALRRDKLAYSDFLRRLFEAGMITFGGDAACAIAPIFVAKSGGRRRLVLGTRKAAVYRVEAPAGWHEFMILPSVAASDLLKVDPTLPVSGVRRNQACRFADGLELVSLLLPARHVVLAHVLKAGFHERDAVSDLHVVKDVTVSPAVATHVDGAAVIGVGRQQVRGRIAAVGRELEASGLRCKGVAVTAEEQTFAGLVFRRGSGEVCLASGRSWKMRLALLELASQTYVSERAVFQLVGHCKSAALLRGPLLSVFSAACRWARKAGGDVWRLWPDVASELRAADAGRPIEPAVASADASTGDGDPAGALFGGFGVAAGLEQANRVVDEDGPLPGTGCLEKCAFESEMERGGGELSDATTAERATRGDFVGLASMVFPLDAWTSALFRRWARPENVLGLEGRGVPLGVRRQFRDVRSRDKIQLLLCENVGLVLALVTGSASSPLLNSSCRELPDVSLFNDSTAAVRWLPSEWNSSDKGSCIVVPPVERSELDARSAGAARAAFERNLLEEVERLERREFASSGERGHSGRGIQRYLEEGDADAW